MKSGGSRPDKIKVGQAAVTDAMALAGAGIAGRTLGVVPAIMTEAGAAAGAYTGNELGDYLVRNDYVSEDVAPYVIPGLTILGGMVGGVSAARGTAAAKAQKATTAAKTAKPEYSNWGGEFVDDYANTHKVISPEVDAPVRYAEWSSNPKPTAYYRIKLPSQKAQQFKDEVDLLNYYATHQTKNPNVGTAEIIAKDAKFNLPEVEIVKIDGKTLTEIGGRDHISGIGKLIGQGGESLVYDPNNGYVYKTMYNDINSGLKTRAWSTNVRDDADLFNTMKHIASDRNKHIFSKKSFPAITRVPGERSIGTLIQEKITPVTDANIKEMNRQWMKLRKSSFWHELYPKFLDGPLDVSPRNFGFDENGVLWGIDLWRKGGTIQKPNFIKRLEDPNRKSILDWESKPTWRNNYTYDISTHKMGYEYAPGDSGRAIVYPEVQEINGKLVDFTRPPFHSWAGYDSALDRGDYLMMKDLEEARKWVEGYKEKYKNLK